MRRINRGDKKAQLEMWSELETLQAAFPYTKEGLFLFASHVLDNTIVGSPKLNLVQMDILDYLCFGGKYLGIMAQRGQTKTTLAAIVCAFNLIHFPHYRILVFSQNGKRAKEIAGWVIKIFYAIEVLDLLLPDTYAGDRSSIEAFDVHWCFRGDDKSPSVACYSIESGAQGARADLILADDIESLQNSRTSVMREWLMEQSLEFESINQYGRIIYLGTPQSSESIYNMLPSRGYNVRIWPGRYPTQEQADYYGDRLAPLLRKHIELKPELQQGGGLDGSLGKPTCPEMYDEETLQEKELRQGLAKFMLQFMLHTGLSDKDRFKLKLENLVVANFNNEEGPIMPVWLSSPSSLWQQAPRFGTRPQDKFYFAVNQAYPTRKFDKTVMYIDPAGGGAKSQDEMAYAIVSLLGTYIYIREVDGVAGGYAESELLKLVMAAKAHKVDSVYVEDNYGNGAHLAMLKPIFEKHYPHCKLEGVHESGQKELRIIDTLEPLLGQHRLVITQTAITRDYQSIQRFSADVKLTYSCFYQMAHITSDRGCLRHDDRLDALAGACRQVVQFVDYDQARSEAQRAKSDGEKFMKTMADPRGYVHFVLSGGDYQGYQSSIKCANALSKFA
ncbi:terminase large subunit [Aeromonas phage vB_AspA_Tola]|nr:terminase large subunit [Aeromonas phage vB_AspA_Tola]